MAITSCHLSTTTRLSAEISASASAMASSTVIAVCRRS
jgi:hypothetical protein